MSLSLGIYGIVILGQMNSHVKVTAATLYLLDIQLRKNVAFTIEVMFQHSYTQIVNIDKEALIGLIQFLE